MVVFLLSDEFIFVFWEFIKSTNQEMKKIDQYKERNPLSVNIKPARPYHQCTVSQGVFFLVFTDT